VHRAALAEEDLKCRTPFPPAVRRRAPPEGPTTVNDEGTQNPRGETPIEGARSTLVFWGEGPAHRAKALHRQGATLLAWGEKGAAALERAGVPYAKGALTPDDQDQVDRAAMDWTKSWGRHPLLDGKNARELWEWDGVPLWWFAEIYLHYTARSPGYVRSIEAFRRILEAIGPDEVEAVGLPLEEAVLLGRTCTAARVLFHGPSRVKPLSHALRTLVVSWQSRWNTLKTFATALKSAIAGPAPRDGTGSVLFLSHAAFWKKRKNPETGEDEPYEHYFDRLIPELSATGLKPFVLALGPRAAFRRRGAPERLADWLTLGKGAPYVSINRYTRFLVARRVLRATSEFRRSFWRLKALPALREAFSYSDVNFADLAGPDLAGTMLLQLPWAVRSYEEISSALAEVKPAVLCLYAESSAWGRVALAACRAARVPSLALQHGILYPNYYSYRHDPDEEACPRPDRTALFGEAARRLLLDLGHYKPESLVVTGSPKFDDLLRAAQSSDRDALRARLGVGKDDRLLLVASRYRAIRQTHQAIGSAFASLLRAVERVGSARLLVKPHPSERPGEYEARIEEVGTERASVLPSSSDLVELLHACDILVTVESLSAVEALVLGRPVLILNMPTNLRELVVKGVALGVKTGEDPTPALKALLEDPAIRRAVDAAREHYLSDMASGVDGGATQRILALIRETAEIARAW
jgi:hypothetical protein